jgi:glycosyltransferase involved in cell wall biosynthesis
LRIIHVVVTGSFAGTERYVCDVSRELAQRGHDTVVIGGSPEAMPHRVGGNWIAAGTLSEAIRALVRCGSADVVHTHLTKADFAAYIAAPRNRAHRVATRHILAPRGFSGPAQRFGSLVRRGLTEIAISNFVRDNIAPPPDYVLPNGVTSVSTARDDNSDKVVLLAQRLEGEKDTQTALNAWALSGLGGRGWRLDVAGTGPDQHDLQEQAESLHIAGSVNFLGWVPDVAERMLRAFAFLAPPPAEPSGLSVLEAMASALPVIASASAGHLETVGLLDGASMFPPADAGACAQALLTLANDPESTRKYGEALQQLQLDRFTIERHVDGLEAIYER